MTPFISSGGIGGLDLGAINVLSIVRYSLEERDSDLSLSAMVEHLLRSDLKKILVTVKFGSLGLLVGSFTFPYAAFDGGN